MYFGRIPLKPEDLYPLQEIIEKADDTTLFPTCNFGNIMYHGNYQLLFLFIQFFN